VNKKFLKYLFVFALLSTLFLTACSSGNAAAVNPSNTQVYLTLSGSGTVTGILQAVADDFEADTPGYHLEVLEGSGTGGGVTGVLEGSLDVVGMARPPKSTEPVEYVTFGNVGMTIVIHPEVGITNLTTRQAIDILTGQITNWSEIGGPNLTLILFIRDEDDSTTKAFREYFFKDAIFAETAPVLTSQGEMLSAIEGTPGGVGMATWPTALASGAEVVGASLDGVPPGDPDFPMMGEIGIGYLSDRQEDVQPLIEWLLSENGMAALQEFEVITSP
jgi:phosphate transport system substrate-binding protein